MTIFNRLLAKSSRTPEKPRGAETLPGHTANVMAAAKVLLEETEDAQLSAVGLSGKTWKDRFRQTVLLSAFCHDLGKANAQFQEMLRGRLSHPQAIRHEALSLLIVQDTPPLEKWLSDFLEEPRDLSFLLWAAAGHHRKFPPGEAGHGTGIRLKLFLGHQDFHRTLTVGAKMLELGEPPVLSDISWKLIGMKSPYRRLKEIELQAKGFWKSCTDEERRFLAITKACVIAADVAGSAIPRTGEKLSGWIRRALQKKPGQRELKKIIDQRLRGAKPRPFQEKLGATTARVVLAKAGCGSGKTLGAYIWAAARAPGKRIFFSYPTTGTATEGFRDYLIDPTLNAQLVHSRVSVDLELLDVGDEKDDEEEQADRLMTIEALEAWSTSITSCTVDTVLGLTQNQKRGMFAWPAFAGAAFVFDEIHAYDDRLFASLLRFLSTCRGVPCLLMTASLPDTRLTALREEMHHIGESVEIVTGPADLEALPRYQRLIGDDPWNVVEQIFRENGKILWVANTVGRARRFAEEAESRGLRPLVYHSRFRYEDRVRQHGRIVDAFREEGSVLAIATQVAEMSLDLSADLLVTDLAPIAPLIQRLGRLNRRSTPESPNPPKPFLVIEPDNVLPYERMDIQDSRTWLERLGMNHVSQAGLVQSWAALGEGGQQRIDKEAAWPDGGFETTPRHLRDSTRGITVILQEDIETVKRGEIEPARVSIPMLPLNGTAWWKWPKEAFAYVPPSEHIDYDPERGAQWNR